MTYLKGQDLFDEILIVASKPYHSGILALLNWNNRDLEINHSSNWHPTRDPLYMSPLPLLTSSYVVFSKIRIKLSSGPPQIDAQHRGPLVYIAAWITLVAMILFVSDKVSTKWTMIRKFQSDDTLMILGMVSSQ